MKTSNDHRHGAQETPHVSPPPSRPIWWRARRKSGDVSEVRVKETFWLDARKSAARLLKCEPGNVLCEQEKQAPEELPAKHRNGVTR